MKTAMQELIDYAHELDFGGWEDVFIQKGTELLEKEKEQIMETFENGVYHARYFREDKEQLDGEEYYNQTYNQNK